VGDHGVTQRLTVFRQLSRRGNVLTLVLGADVNPTIPSVTKPDGGAGPISPGAASWPYRALPPSPLQLDAPVGLTIIDSATTRTSVNLTWTAPSTGDRRGFAVRGRPSRTRYRRTHATRCCCSRPVGPLTPGILNARSSGVFRSRRFQ
jgi:hypothetical protein